MTRIMYSVLTITQLKFLSHNRYSVPHGCTVIQWVTDFRLRIIQLQQVSLLVSQGGAKELKVILISYYSREEFAFDREQIAT